MNKPKCKLIGENGNVFNLMSICKKALLKANMKKEYEEMADKIYKAKSYDEALYIMSEYVDIE